MDDNRASEEWTDVPHESSGILHSPQLRRFGVPQSVDQDNSTGVTTLAVCSSSAENRKQGPFERMHHLAKENFKLNLLHAAAAGLLHECNRLLHSGVEADQVLGPQGETPLLRALQENHCAVAAQLVEAGASVSRAIVLATEEPFYSAPGCFRATMSTLYSVGAAHPLSRHPVTNRLLLSLDHSTRNVEAETIEVACNLLRPDGSWWDCVCFILVVDNLEADERGPVIAQYIQRVGDQAKGSDCLQLLRHLVREFDRWRSRSDVRSEEAVNGFHHDFVRNYHKALRNPRLPPEAIQVLVDGTTEQRFHEIARHLLFVLGLLKKHRATTPQLRFLYSTAAMGLRLFRGDQFTDAGGTIPAITIAARQKYGSHRIAYVAGAKALIAGAFELCKPRTLMVVDFVKRWLLVEGARPTGWHYLRSEIYERLGDLKAIHQSTVAQALEADDEADQGRLQKHFERFLLGSTQQLPVSVMRCGRLLRAWLREKLEIEHDCFIHLFEAFFMAMRGHNLRLDDPEESHRPACAGGAYLQLVNMVGLALLKDGDGSVTSSDLHYTIDPCVEDTSAVGTKNGPK